MPGHIERDFRATRNGQVALKQRKNEREKQYFSVVAWEKTHGFCLVIPTPMTWIRFEGQEGGVYGATSFSDLFLSSHFYFHMSTLRKK